MLCFLIFKSRLAFEVVQVPPSYIEGIFSVLSSVLWLGNMTFKVIQRILSVHFQINKCSNNKLKIKDSDNENAELTNDDKTVLDVVSRLLGLSESDLHQV